MTALEEDGEHCQGKSWTTGAQREILITGGRQGHDQQRLKLTAR